MTVTSPDPISATRLSEIMGLIYECAIDPGQWPSAMEAMRIALGGANCSLDLMSADARSLLNITTNIPAPFCDTIMDYSAQVYEDWGGSAYLLASPLDEPGTLLRHNPDFGKVETARLRDWVRPQGLGDVLGIWLARDAETFGFIGFGRLSKDGPYGDREMAIARLFVPHLQRAATINRLHDIAALKQASFDSLFDTLAVPILIVAGDMNLVHANASARNLIERREMFDLRAGLVVARHLGTHRALAMAIRQATVDASDLGRKGLGIPLPQDDGSIGALHVLPLGNDGKTVAIFVARTMFPLIAPSQVIASLFGLTPSEGRVFDHIAAGRTVAQAAVTLGVGESTVRTHLLRLYDKTGVRRQAELVHMAASLAVPVTH